jgi:hypothetical protein
MLLLDACGRANSEVGASVREDIQCRRHFHQETRMTVRHPCHHRPKLDAIGSTRSVSQGSPSFKHFLFWATKPGNLEHMIWNPRTVETGALSAFNNQAKGVTKPRLTLWPGKVGDG